MNPSGWNRKLLANTRGKIVAMLRSGNRTVGELARELGLTENAIRQHLSLLEREGIVQRSGVRPGVRKPHIAFELTRGAEQLFAKAYGLALEQLLSVMMDRLPKSDVASIMREAGNRLAQQFTVGDVTWEERLKRAVKVYDALGGLAEIERIDGEVYLRGDSCPLASDSADHHLICIMLEEMLAQLIELPVHTLCDREPRYQCCFEISPPLSAQPSA